MRAPPGIVEADDRDAAFDGQVLDAADLLRLHLGERATEHGEILREDRHAAPADLAEAGDDAVAREALPLQPELADLVRGERAELLESAFVQQQRQPLAGGELAARVLLLDSFPATAEHGSAAHFAQRLQVFVGLGLHWLDSPLRVMRPGSTDRGRPRPATHNHSRQGPWTGRCGRHCTSPRSATHRFSALPHDLRAAPGEYRWRHRRDLAVDQSFVVVRGRAVHRRLRPDDPLAT